MSVLHFNRAILFVVLLGLASTVVAGADGATFYFDKTEGGSFSQRALSEFQQYMAEQQCPVTVVNDSAAENILLFFSAKPLEKSVTDTFNFLLDIKTWNDLPITSAILVRASTGIDNLKSLEDTRVAYITDGSYLGYEIPVRMFKDAGADPGKQEMHMASSHDSAMGLLLHKDVFVSIIAGPLAHRWAEANELAIVAESEPLDIGKVLISRSASEETVSVCRTALLNLKRTTFSDKRMNVFPRWVEGFRSLQEHH